MCIWQSAGIRRRSFLRASRATSRRLSYRELHAEVCRCANALQGAGRGAGDRVIIYMPLTPEVVIAMHACARIGAIHSVVFGGFSASSLKDRIEDTGAKLVITADGGWRGGHMIESQGRRRTRRCRRAARRSSGSSCTGVPARTCR